MVTRSAPCEASETWHMRLRVGQSCQHRHDETINLPCARVNNNGEESEWGGKKEGREGKLTVHSRSLKAKS